MNTFESVTFINECYDLQVMNEFAISKFIDKLKQIKNNKPDEYTSNEEVKEFVDKNYNDLVDISNILEKEPKELRKTEIKTLLGGVTTLIGQFTLLGGLEANSIIMTVFGGVGVFLSVTFIIVSAVVSYIRANKDIEAANDLNKIRSSLKKVQNNENLENEYKRKISKIISKIDDAETEYSDRVKVQD